MPNDIIWYAKWLKLSDLNWPTWKMNPLFSVHFLENCVYKKQKKSIKYQGNYCSNTFVKVFANSVIAYSKIWCLHFFYEQNNIVFFIPPVIWNWRMFIFDNCNGVQFIPNISFLSQSSKCQSMVIKSLLVWII